MRRFIEKIQTEEFGRGIGNIYLLIMIIPLMIWGIWMIVEFISTYLDDIKKWCRTKQEKFYDWKNRKYTKLNMEEK